MHDKKWRLTFAFSLVAASAAVYMLHYQIFHDLKHLLKYGLHELAFVPLEVLLVSMILHGLLERRERTHKLQKMNMIIGTFFVEMGTDALGMIAAFDTDEPALPGRYNPTPDWTDKEYAQAIKAVRGISSGIDAGSADLEALNGYFAENRDFMMRMLENPNLLEHDTFTDLLWALIHLAEELRRRQMLSDLPASDLEHLSGDIQRVYATLLAQWLEYLNHLRLRYPYLYSLALRTNPFDPNADPVVG